MATAIAITATVISAAAATYSQVTQHRQERANAEMEAEEQAYNARQAEREAEAVAKETQENVRRQKEESERLRSRQIAALGASGAAMTQGSPLALLAQSAADEELKIHDLQYQGARQRQQYMNQANLYNYRRGVALAGRPSTGSLTAGIVGTWAKAGGKIVKEISNDYKTGGGRQ